MDWAELGNWDEYVKLLIGLFAVADPIGSLPVVLGMLENRSVRERRQIVASAAATFALTLLVFTYTGALILDLFGITIAALKIAGGVMFLFYALEMMGLIRLPASANLSAPGSPASIGVVPIGIPLLAGPGSISTVIIFADLHGGSLAHTLLVSGVIVTAGVLILALYLTSAALGHRLSDATLSILNRVLGLLLAAIAVEFILDGIVAHFPAISSIH